MSGIDLHASTRLRAGEGVLSRGADGTYTREFFVKALELNGAEVFAAQDAAGQLHWGSQIAPPLRQWKLRFSTGYHWGDCSVANYLNTVSG